MAVSVEAYLAIFLAMLDERFRQYGAADGLPAPLRRAVEATPRHRFVHRFRMTGIDRVRDFDAEPDRFLPLVYSDELMGHVDVDGAALPSSNSQPSYVVWLVHRLGIAPGHRVLEIGSGSGWLAALMGRLAGARGRVTGIEIIPGLAEQSRADLVALGLDTVTIMTGDGTASLPGGPFDRAIVTAATWDIPASLFDAVAEGGRLLVPILLSGGHGCQVTLLRRDGEVFRGEEYTLGQFVPLVGQGQPTDEESDKLRRAVPKLPDLGPPGPSTYDFAVMRASDAPEADDAVHVERRGDSALVRRLRPGAGTWSDLRRRRG